MNATKKDNMNYVAWFDVNEDFDKAKETVYKMLGKNVSGDHSINMDFHFILDDEQLSELTNYLNNGIELGDIYKIGVGILNIETGENSQVVDAKVISKEGDFYRLEICNFGGPIHKVHKCYLTEKVK